ncbi:MAG: response regulator transcription factor [Burkholderiaceae bacterium]
MRVLLVEDDPMIGATVEQALNDAEYAVDWVRDGASALHASRTQAYGLVLLDLGLPQVDGAAVLQALRSGDNPVPVLVITARDGVDERIRALDSGADDYLIKPFELGELLARMRAVARRQGGTGGPVLTNGPLTLDPATRNASVNGAAVLLSGREFALLQALLIRPGAILSRSELEDRLYGWGNEVESNAVEVVLHGLRKKVGSAAIKNVRGVGWMVAKAT